MQPKLQVIDEWCLCVIIAPNFLSCTMVVARLGTIRKDKKAESGWRGVKFEKSLVVGV